MARSMDVSDLTDAARARLKRDLRSVILDLRKVLGRRLKRAHVDEEERLLKDDFNRELAAKLEAELSGLLAELGYDGAIGRLLDTFEKVEAVTEGALENRLSESFAGVSVRGLTAFVDGTVDELVALKGAAGERLRKVLLLGVNTNVPLESAIEDMADAVGVALNEAQIIAETALSAFHREILVSQSEAAGIDLFYYDGPDDELLRDFCSTLVGKVFTASDLDEMDNGQGLEPVSRYLGGYRCRHFLAPITVDEARDLPATAIGGREARRIVLRGGVGENEAAFLEKNQGKVTKRGRVVRRRAG